MTNSYTHTVQSQGGSGAASQNMFDAASTPTGW